MEEAKPEEVLIRKNYKMVLEYDGTDYSGWQTQKDMTGGRTIQQELELHLTRLALTEVKVICSGRTDAGVHALGQVISFKAAFPWDEKRLMYSLNSMLPPSIAARSVEVMDDSFNALGNAKWKRYRYMIENHRLRSPLKSRYAWWMPVNMDMERMRRAAEQLVGTHDFSSFKGKACDVKHFVRTIRSVSLEKDESGMIIFEIVGEGFLRHMVRIIVGTLVEIGRGKLQVEDMRAIIDAQDRQRAGRTAPAHGLCLVEVGYE